MNPINVEQVKCNPSSRRLLVSLF